ARAADPPGPTPAALAASTPTATPTPTPASVRTGAAVRTVLSILGVCIPTSKQSCPHPPVTGIRPRWWIALLQWAHRCTPGGGPYAGGRTHKPPPPADARRPRLRPPSGRDERKPGGTDRGRGAADRNHTTPDRTDGQMSVRSRILARVVAVTALGWPRATASIPSAAWPPARPRGPAQDPGRRRPGRRSPHVTPSPRPAS